MVGFLLGEDKEILRMENGHKTITRSTPNVCPIITAVIYNSRVLFHVD